MLYLHNKTVTEKKYLTKLPCQNKLIFKYMIYKSSAWPVTFGARVSDFELCDHRIEPALAWEVFYNQLTHSNSHEVRVFNLRILVSRLRVNSHMHKMFDMYSKYILYIY